jgi:hypothetical protein
MAPPKRYDWKSIRLQYESSPLNLYAVAKLNEMALPTLAARAKKEGWAKPSIADRNSEGVEVGNLPAIPPPVEELPVAELAKMQQRTVNGHRIDVEKDMAHLNSIAAQIEASKRLTPVMKLNALGAIVKIRGQLQDLERRAWRVPEAVEQPKVAVQVNLNLEPSAAYLEMIGKGRAG